MAPEVGLGTQIFDFLSGFRVFSEEINTFRHFTFTIRHYPSIGQLHRLLHTFLGTWRPLTDRQTRYRSSWVSLKRSSR